MFTWSTKSKQFIEQCDFRLQCLVNLMLHFSKFDLTVTCGYRNEQDQENAFKDGKSKLHFGQSKHNFLPSKAIDICPYPINWDTNDKRWKELGALAKRCAELIGISIIWGGDYQSFKDYPHIELKE